MCSTIVQLEIPNKTTIYLS